MRRIVWLGIAALAMACEGGTNLGVFELTNPSCEQDDECIETFLAPSCCDQCSSRALTRGEAENFRMSCRHRQLRCPQLDCPVPPETVAACVEHRCVIRLVDSSDEGR